MINMYLVLASTKTYETIITLFNVFLFLFFLRADRNARLYLKIIDLKI